jgi:hypothetical protein
MDTHCFPSAQENVIPQAKGFTERLKSRKSGNNRLEDAFLNVPSLPPAGMDARGMNRDMT